MRWIAAILFVFCVSHVQGQENLVYNPSFESHTDCPSGNGSISLAPPWRKVGVGGAGVVYYHECGYNGYGTPQNSGGFEYPHSGVAYSKVILWLSHAYEIPFEGNFIGAPLISPLSEGQRYLVEFYISLLDSNLFATNKIGVHFSQWQPQGDIWDMLELEPHVQYTDSAFLVVKDGWMKISGSFIAEGGEDFFSIGNFDGYDNSDSLYVGNGGVPWPGGTFNWDAAYYYLDDVSVVEDTSYHVGSPPAPQRGEIKLWPNPAKTTLVIETENRANQSLTMYDATGREVLQKQLIGQRNEIDIATLPKGVYVAVLRQKGVAVGREKVVVQ